MSRIHVNRFLGAAPKIGATALDPRQAVKALNAKLWSEQLRSFSGLLAIEAIGKTGDIKTIYNYNNKQDWLAWTQDVDCAPGPIAGDTLEKLYFTGTDKPRVTTNDIFNDGVVGTNRPPDSFILGIPAPVGPPVASDTGAGNITGTGLTWVYTFVRKYSDGTIEESAPSPPSNALTLTSRQASVTLPNGAITTADYGITHKRLYRDGGTGYLFVAEVTIGTSPTTDNLAAASLGDLIETTDYLPPPDNMVGLIGLPNGIMAGFAANEIFLSDPYRPHAYPLLNRYALNWPIVGIGQAGTAIIVATTAYPYIGRGVDPAGYSFKQHPGIFPCTSKRGVASGRVGVMWPTPSGMALSDGVSVVDATRDFVTRDEWTADFYPTTMHGEFHEGRYYGWFENGEVDAAGVKLGGGFVLDRDERAFLVTLGEYVYASHNVPDTDELYIAKKNPLTANANHIYEWEGDPGSPLAYEWKSKVFISDGRENFAFGQIIADYGVGLSAAEIAALQAAIAAVEAFNDSQPDTDGPFNGNGASSDAHGFELNGGAPLNGDTYLQEAPSTDYISGVVTFRYWADGVLVLEVSVSSNEPFPMPAGFTAEKHQFEVAGSVETAQVTMATSVEELGAV